MYAKIVYEADGLHMGSKIIGKYRWCAEVIGLKDSEKRMNGSVECENMAAMDLA